MKKKIIVAGVILIIIVGGYFYYKNKQKIPTPNTVTAEIKNILQEVSVTGRVKPASSVDLAFEKGGKIVFVGAKIGERVGVGEILLKQDDSELKAMLAKAEADLSAENLDNIHAKADVDLASIYDGAITTAQKSATVGKNAIFTLTDLQYAHFNQSDKDSAAIANTKGAAVLSLLGQADAGKWNNDSLGSLTGGTFGNVQKATVSRIYSDVDAALSSLLSALQKIKIALDTVPVISGFSAAEKTNLNSEETNISAEITLIAGKIQAINVQKVTNANSISAVEAAINSAKASIQNIQAQISKTSLASPIAGIISKEDPEIGEIVQASSIIVSVISNSNFEIEAAVPEADIAKIKIGDNAKVTLDAYGSDTFFDTKVASIDPAERIIDGVATYKTTLQFTKNDERIRSGMTANINVSTAASTNVIAVPARVVFTKNSKKYVTIYLGDDKNKDREIEIGIQGTDGNIEIVSGLKEGEKIIIPKAE